jgi:predicted HTH domain antitoxin
LKEIIETVPTFRTEEEKERFLIVLGALSLRLISLAKASEIMEMDRYTFLRFLDAFGVDFSHLEVSDVDVERSWE